MKKLFMSALLTVLCSYTVMAQDAKEVVTPPENLVSEPYWFQATDPRNNETFSKEVKVGFNDNEVYIQGISDYLKEAWVKGTLDNGTLTIPETYLGFYDRVYIKFDMNFTGATFTYDADNLTFKSQMGFRTMNGNQAIEFCMDVTIKHIIERAEKPATPVCQFAKSDYGTMYVLNMIIPLEDINGEPLVSDKLSYIVYIEKNQEISPLTFVKELYPKITENMTEIPYNYTDNYDIDNYMIYMNQAVTEMKTWTKIGVQSIYRGGGEENRSDINWFNMAEFWNPVGITDIPANTSNHNDAIYNISGQRVTKAQQGIYIINGKKIIIK